FSPFFILSLCLSCSPSFPYTTLFRSYRFFTLPHDAFYFLYCFFNLILTKCIIIWFGSYISLSIFNFIHIQRFQYAVATTFTIKEDRKSTRLNSSHVSISYAVFCSKKK